MQTRVFRIQSRNPIVGVAIGLIVVAVILLVLGLGVALLAGAAVIGGVGLLARRVLRLRRPAPAILVKPDPAREVFAPREANDRRTLPPGGV
jgi:hypothetical protein